MGSPSFEVLRERLFYSACDGMHFDVFLHPDCEKRWPYGYSFAVKYLKIDEIKQLPKIYQPKQFYKNISFNFTKQMLQPLAEAYLWAEQSRTYLNRCDKRIIDQIRGYLCQYGNTNIQNPVHGTMSRKFLGLPHSFDGIPHTVRIERGQIIYAKWDYLDNRSKRSPDLYPYNKIQSLRQSTIMEYEKTKNYQADSVFHADFDDDNISCKECDIRMGKFCSDHTNMIQQLLLLCNKLVIIVPYDPIFSILDEYSKPSKLSKPSIRDKEIQTIHCNNAHPHIHLCTCLTK